MGIGPSMSARTICAARTAALAVACAALVTIAVWGIAQTVAGLNVRLGSGSASHVGVASVLLVSVLAALAAIATRQGAERTLTRPRRVWTRTALIVLVVSLAGPLSAGTTVAIELCLAAMHLAAGAVLIATLRPGPSRRREASQ
jgi:hypothetical protein